MNANLQRFARLYFVTQFAPTLEIESESVSMKVLLSILWIKQVLKPHTTDDYFVHHDTPTDFTVHGQLVTVDSERLARTLLFLSERRREVILLRYYLRLNDVQIAALYGSPLSTIQYQKQAALKQHARKWRKEKIKSKLVPYETIETGSWWRYDFTTCHTAALQVVYGYLSNGDTVLKKFSIPSC